MITGKNESKSLTKDLSCECKCKFNGTKWNSNQWWNNINVNVNVKNIIYVKMIMFGTMLQVIVKIENM